MILLPQFLGAGEAPWKTGKGQGNILLLSDIHFDPYTHHELVPRLQAAPVEEWDSIFSEAVKAKLAPYGKDTNFVLFLSSLAAVQTTGLHYDYALVSGDFISHHFREQFHQHGQGGDKEYQAFVLKTVEYVTYEIQKTLKGVPVYFCLGNNDSDCDDYSGLVPGSPFLPTLAKDWPTVAADPQAVSSFTQGGYYTVLLPGKGRRLVVLNDVSWSLKYSPDCKAPESEGQAELLWLKGVLQRAKAAGERVTVMTHMPPGIHGRNASEHADRTKPQHTFYAPTYLWPFLNLLAPYRSIIDGEFCGHTHMDDFRVVRDRGGKNVFLVHITPAISPVHNNNPGFQAMLYDKKTGGYKDMATYYLSNLETAGPTEPAKWELEYDFDKAYACKAYDMGSLVALAGNIEKDPDVRNLYIKYVPVSSTNDPPATADNWRFFGSAQLNMDPSSYMQSYRRQGSTAKK